MELSAMSLTELRRLKGKIETEIKRRSDSTRKDLLKRMQKMASEAGMSLGDIVGAAPEETAAKKATKKPGRKARTAGTKVPVKYRHPENTTLAWTGRGRKPKWVEEWLAGGKTIEELAV